ncbi:MAG: DnaJ domain-containing protein [Dorea sp.]|nr:DnaJ domain-containing protein [Dorea sp.]
MKAYFNNVQTLDELRKQYKDLLKKYHPDNENGSEEITKAINTEYERLFIRY